MIKNVVIFLIGFAGGAAAGHFGTKKVLVEKYHKMADEEIAEMREYYEKLQEDLVVEVAGKEEKRTPDFTQDISKNEPEPREKDAEETPASEVPKTNYRKYYDDPADLEYPTDDDIEDEDVEIAETMNEWLRRNEGKEPRIISVDAVGDLPAGVDHQILYLYSYDYVVADDNENEVEDYDRLLGNCLEKYNFFESEEKLIFVVNYELCTVYEIQKVEAAFCDL